ncbi:MAG: AAA family ATPase [Anaerolineales bacterium]|nr:AAA family ATPase [Anaerolineales bacterium]
MQSISLARFMQNEPHSELETCLVCALSVTTAVQTMHQQYTVHGSLNPTTICFSPQGNIQPLTPKQNQRQQLLYMAPEQTGRLNHPFDQRTDLYALGLIFYELFTAQHPFPLSDPIQLIHAHLAMSPPPPRQIRPDLPAPVADILLKLLAKEPEERYQSAAGLAADLSHCLAAWQTRRQIAPFPLAASDMSARLLLPTKRYGHTAVWAQLRTAVLDSPTPQMLCLWGEAGLGKSRLLSDLHTAVSQTDTTWLMHQAQPADTTSPYTAVTALLQAFVRQLLTRDPAQIAYWQTRLTHTLIGNSTQLLRHIPELNLLLDLSPDQHIETSDPQLLLRMACQNMLALLAETEPRLVLVVDDAHYADRASRELLQNVVGQRRGSVVLLLAAQPVPNWLDAHPAMQQISLSPLTLSETTAFVADALHITAVEATPLAELLQRKTNGNPLFLRELMHALHDDHGLLTFEPAARRWQWDLAQIEAAPLADNVVALVQKRLELLPTAVQQTLKVAALLGNWFELDLLTQACQQTWGETAQAVWQARTLGLLQPHGSTAVEPFAAAQRCPRQRLQTNDHRLLGLARFERGAATTRADATATDRATVSVCPRAGAPSGHAAFAHQRHGRARVANWLAAVARHVARPTRSQLVCVGAPSRPARSPATHEPDRTHGRGRSSCPSRPSRARFGGL